MVIYYIQHTDMSVVMSCPRCFSEAYVKSGYVNNRQRYRCKSCNYFFSVQKPGKKIDAYYVTKALQLYLEGISYREIEHILGVSHVSVMNWVKQYGIRRPSHSNFRATYRIMRHNEVVEFFSDPKNLANRGMILTELGDKYMLIKWDRFRD